MMDTSYKRYFGGLYMKDIKYWAHNKSSGKHVNSQQKGVPRLKLNVTSESNWDEANCVSSVWW